MSRRNGFKFDTSIERVGMAKRDLLKIKSGVVPDVRSRSGIGRINFGGKREARLWLSLIDFRGRRRRRSRRWWKKDGTSFKGLFLQGRIYPVARGEMYLRLHPLLPRKNVYGEITPTR